MKTKLKKFAQPIGPVYEDLLCLWVIEGVLAAAKGAEDPVLERCQVKLFTVHVYSLSVFEIKL